MNKITLKILILFIYFVNVCGVGMFEPWHTCGGGSADNVQEAVLSSHHVCSRHPTLHQAWWTAS